MTTFDLPVDPATSLGDLVVQQPARAVVLEQFGLDYCCGGRRTLAAACATAGVDVAEVAARLAAVTGERPSWLGGSLTDLVDHIESTHHAYLHETLPTLRALAAKVHDVHGGRHAELADVHRLVDAIADDIGPHLRKEETVLFPACRRLDAAQAAVAWPFGVIGNPVRVMESEHETVGALLDELRTATGGYAVPEDGCASYHQLYERLAALEADTHEHIHLENNVLHPAAVAKDEALRTVVW